MNLKDLFNKTSRKQIEEKTEERKFHTCNFEDFSSISFSGSSYSNEYAMKLSAVYRCVNVISDAVAQLPMEIFRIDRKGFKVKDKKNPTFNVLNCKPNKRMTRYTFISLLVQSMLLKGNAFAYIMRGEKGIVKELVYVPADYVTIIPPTTILEPVKYRVEGFKNEVNPEDMIHLINYTYDGVVGISTLYYARQTLGLVWDAESSATGFYSAGCSLSGIIKSETNLTPKQKQEIKNSFKNAFGSKNGEPGGIAVLEGSLSYSPISVNAKDSQLLETREFGVIEICRFFGVSPTKVGDLSHSSYSTLESSQLAFLTDTISPLLEKIELEFETKLFPDGNIDIRFDVAQLLRADRQSLAQYYSTLIQNGVMQINEVRKELDLPSVEGGDSNFVQVNLQTLERATSENPETTQDIKEKLND